MIFLYFADLKLCVHCVFARNNVHLSSNSDFCISSVTHYEIGLGNKKSHYQFWNELHNSLSVIPFDKACSATAIEIYLELKNKNKMIDIADICIAATAKTYNIKIATLNHKHFSRISGLEIM